MVRHETYYQYQVVISSLPLIDFPAYFFVDCLAHFSCSRKQSTITIWFDDVEGPCL